MDPGKQTESAGQALEEARERFDEQNTAINEALVVSSVRQHELTQRAEKLNGQLLAEIAERNRVRAALLESETRYRSLFDSMDEGFCILEKVQGAAGEAVDFRYIEANAAFEAHSGVGNVVGRTIRQMFPGISEDWYETYVAVLATGEPIRFERALAPGARTLELYAFRVDHVTQRRVAVIFTDISERKRIEVALTVATDAAEQANRAKSDFLSNMSHELRTPLNGILGFAQLMEAGSPPPTPSQQLSIEHILKAGWYLLELINEILDLALVESGQLMLAKEPVPLAEVILECRDLLEVQAQKRGIGLRFPRFEIAWHVQGDRIRVKQVLVNLLSNAIKYNRPDGTVTVKCVLSSPDSIRIDVRDTGMGLTPERLGQLFQPFNRLGKESGAEEGTGIGLVVSKRLVELMGGTIGAESTEGVGSVFWIELPNAVGPRLAVPEAAPGAPANRQVPEGTPLRTLLYVEDNPANVELVKQLVARRPDLHLLSAADAHLGIACARADQPAVILMDINLPGISGIEALKILRADASTAHIPVIALSANGIPDDIERALRAGFLDYITKPIRIDQFMVALDAALAVARTASGLAAEKD